MNTCGTNFCLVSLSRGRFSMIGDMNESLHNAHNARLNEDDLDLSLCLEGKEITAQLFLHYSINLP